MSTLSAWFDYVATAKILICGLIVGAALPALFALAVRLGAAADAADGPRPALLAARRALFTVLALIVAVGVLFISRDFIAHRIGFAWDDWGDWQDVLGLA